MEKNSQIYFDDEFDKKYDEFIVQKNILIKKHIELFYEVIRDMISDNGINLKTWIGETNLRKYIYELRNEMPTISRRVDSYIKEEVSNKEKAATFKIQRIQVENKIKELVQEYESFLSQNESIQTAKLTNINNSHPNFNSNLFTENGYKFFKYLFEEYINEGKITKAKFLNVYFYFNEKLTKNDFKLIGTKIQYLSFIEENYLESKFINTDRPSNYQETALGIIQNKYALFIKGLKSINSSKTT